MNILICDDIQNEIDKLTALFANSDYTTNIIGINNGADAQEFIRSGKRIDVCFLDIVMPEMNGIELARELRGAGYSGEIVIRNGVSIPVSKSYSDVKKQYLQWVIFGGDEK